MLCSIAPSNSWCSVASICPMRIHSAPAQPCWVPPGEDTQELPWPLISFGFSQWEKWRLSGREESEVSAFIHAAPWLSVTTSGCICAWKVMARLRHPSSQSSHFLGVHRPTFLLGVNDLGVTMTVASFGATAPSLMVLLCPPHFLVNSSRKSSGCPKLSAPFPSGVPTGARCNDPTRHGPLLFLLGR